ncbi:30S ribosomal protein S4 [Candidatus Saccharibacteria bacterium]|nr:30S ribosomal protein S4 [Candidatus Saccharibacteria bacterium]MCA9347934.1 30S ribosomal protein S4 [Candidatus Saccharibacteria bacterium]
MARDLQPVVKLSKREGYALHPKAHKALAKKAAPATKGGRNSRSKASQYAIQLREKQKVKRIYGLLERQFSKLMQEASRKKGQSGTQLLLFLEQRLDNVVYRSGFAVSRRAARQLVSHGHFNLNGRRVDIPSIRVSQGDNITVRESSKKTHYFTNLDDVSPGGQENEATWLKVDRKKLVIDVKALPTRDDVEPDINEQLIIEYYSR